MFDPEYYPPNQCAGCAEERTTTDFDSYFNDEWMFISIGVIAVDGWVCPECSTALMQNLLDGRKL